MMDDLFGELLWPLHGLFVVAVEFEFAVCLLDEFGLEGKDLLGKEGTYLTGKKFESFAGPASGLGL